VQLLIFKFYTSASFF